jgi:hypothetical protein
MTRAVRFLGSGVLAVILYLPSGPRADVGEDLRNLRSNINPLKLALSPVFDYAADKTDGVLQKATERLFGQLNAFALNVNDLAKNRIDQLDDGAKNRIRQTADDTSSLIKELKAAADDTTQLGNEALKARIDQATQQLAQVIDGLPLTKVVFLPSEPLKLLKDPDDTTTALYVAGAGLNRGGTFDSKPTATLIQTITDGKRSETRRTELNVAAASPGLLAIDVPAKFFADSARAVRNQLELVLPTGSLIFGRNKTHSLPLLMCGRPPKIDVKYSASATGRIWDSRLVFHPDAALAKDNAHGFYTDGGNARQVCATAHPGWEIDGRVDEASGQNGWHCGLRVGLAKGGGHYHESYPKCGCATIWAGPTDWEIMGDVMVAERQQRAGSCGPPIDGTLHLVAGRGQALLDLGGVTAKCREPGISEEPVTRLQVTAQVEGLAGETAIIPKGVAHRFFDGRLAVAFDRSGVVAAVGRSPCAP